MSNPLSYFQSSPDTEAVNTKICKNCNIEKLFEKFAKLESGNRRSVCNTCRDKRKHEKSKERSAVLLNKNGKQEKFCYQCHSYKPIEQFVGRLRFKKKDVVLTCNECRNKKWKRAKRNPRAENKKSVAEYRKLRNEAYSQWMYNYKKDKKCLDCGESCHPVSMDFDHVSGKKICNISSMREASFEKILQEISKCELVCSNCHRKRTHKQYGGYSKNRTSYQQKRRDLINKKKNNPCELCKKFFEPYQMDFDHINQKDKQYNPKSLIYKTTEKLLKELKKCRLLCSNCHRVETFEKRKSQ